MEVTIFSPTGPMMWVGCSGLEPFNKIKEVNVMKADRASPQNIWLKVNCFNVLMCCFAQDTVSLGIDKWDLLVI